MLAFVGCRTTKQRAARGEGISVYHFDPDTGDLQLLHVKKPLFNPSYLTLNRQGNVLYTVHGDGSEVSAFRIGPERGELSLIGSQTTQGKNPVHLALSSDERYLVVSNHLTSNLAVFPIDEQGAICPLSQLVPLEGECGPHRKEQPFSKPHFNQFSPSGEHVLVPDKGLDAIFCFRFEQGKLVAAESPMVQARECSGPRHLVFHQTQPWVYAINELDSTVTAYRFNVSSGQLIPFQIVSGLADCYTGNNRASAIVLDAKGRTLYTSHRGSDTIAVMSVDEGSGRVNLMQSIGCGGKTPRFITLCPSGKWMLVLNEDSDDIVVFAVDPHSGQLSETGKNYASGSPVSLVFADGDE